jgi:hypothetical protein
MKLIRWIASKLRRRRLVDLSPLQRVIYVSIERVK